jgi:predicted RNA binding protein YcfA (HicA-like mRNA interferase family)
MKRIDLERYLREQGCVPYREGGGHSIWLNSAQRKIASVPRHREIKEGTVRAICKQLEIPQP